MTRSASTGGRLLAACVLLLLSACDGQAESRAERFWKQRRERIEPPELWSAQVIAPRAVGRPIVICTDRQLRGGFVRPLPAVGSQPCVRFGQPVAAPHGQVFRCRIGERRFAVYSMAQGDLGRDFTSSFTIRPLDDDGPDRGQTIRFRRMGRCPAGWDPGDATDQQGRRVRTLNLW